jgi:hypothetical protein
MSLQAHRKADMLKHELHTWKSSLCIAVKAVKVVMAKNHPHNPLMLNAVKSSQTITPGLTG